MDAPWRCWSTQDEGGIDFSGVKDLVAYPHGRQKLAFGAAFERTVSLKLLDRKSIVEQPGIVSVQLVQRTAVRYHENCVRYISARGEYGHAVLTLEGFHME